MVAFKAGQTASFIKSPLSKFSAAMVYGPDAALVSERARELARAYARAAEPEAELIRIDDRDLAEDPDKLTVECKMLSMFSERRVVHVKAERRLKPEALKELLADELAATLIVEAGNLRPTSPLRKLFEANDRVVALPCYADPARDMGPLIDSELASGGVRISREARDYLINRLGTDLGQARGECTKLATYAGPDTEIGIEDIDAIIGDMGAGMVDALATATLDGKTRDALSQLDALLSSGQSTHGALAALSRTFQRLHRLCAAVEAGEQAKSAIAKIRPPLHFKQRDALLVQSRNWSRRAAANALQRVQETIQATRLTPNLDAELTERLLIAISIRKSSKH
jgi:DNA polymerase-3 subunit delta